MSLTMSTALSRCPHTIAAPAVAKSVATRLRLLQCVPTARDRRCRSSLGESSLGVERCKEIRDSAPVVGGAGGWRGREGGMRSRRLSVMTSAMGSASQTVPNEKVDEETRFWEQIQTHQKAAARLSKVEEARTLLAASSTATLSTISQKYDGFPLGSMVLYATDDSGRPILAISSLSPHTKDLETNPKCSLLISRDASDISDTVVTIIGKAETVSDADWDGVRLTYLTKHPDACWVDFGDFKLVRITPKKIRFLAGSATAFAAFGEIDGEDYLASSVDPIAQFSAPIAGHMNRDHADQTKEIAEKSLGVKIDYARILQMDRLGFNIQSAHDGRQLKLRIPFPRPAQDRKDVKNLIVEMLQGSASPTTSD